MLVKALVDLSAVLIQMHDITVVNSHATVDKTLYLMSLMLTRTLNQYSF